MTVAFPASLNPRTVLSRTESPFGERVIGAAVGKPSVRSSVTATPWRATLPAASRRSMRNRYAPSGAAARPLPEVMRPSQVADCVAAFTARQPLSQRRTRPAASWMPTRTLHDSAGLYASLTVSVWPSPLGLNVAGVAPALFNPGADVSTVIETVAGLEAPAADDAVSSAV